jgi:hypothetical protein
MVMTMVEGSPEDFWSLQEDLLRSIELDRKRYLAPQIGRTIKGPLAEAIFDVGKDVDAPLHIGTDPYDRLSHVSLN